MDDPLETVPYNAREGDAQGRGSGLEKWLRSRWRLRLLVLCAVLLLSALSTRMWLDAAQAVGMPVSWSWVFARRLVDWGLWGLAFEPLVWLARLSARWLRHAVPLILLHVLFSVVVAEGMSEARYTIARDLLGPPPLPAEFERTRRPEPEGREQVDDGTPSPERDGDRRSYRGRGGDGRFGRGRFDRGRLDLGILLYWSILVLAWGIQTFLRNREQERAAVDLRLRAARLERELANARLSSLKSQLHPHFLFNTLHTVGGMIRERREETALSVLAGLGDLLRAALEQADVQEVELARELELAELYLNIERVRFGDRLNVTVGIEPGVARVRVPALVLLPLVENAVKYGIAPRTEGGLVEISARREAGLAWLEVLDDGPGFPPEMLEAEPRRSGARAPIGLDNTRERLHALHGDAAGLELANRPGGGASVRIWLPDSRGSGARDSAEEVSDG